MSLQVWLPLTNGTLKQQGLKNAVATIGGTVGLTDVGKLGKCATIGTAAGGITLPASAMTSFTECSVAFWINITSWNTDWDTIFQAGLGSTPWNNYIFGILRNQGNYLCFTVSNGSSTSSGSYASSNLTVGQWMHLAFTYGNGKCKIYINGVLDKEYSTSITPNFAGITHIAIGRSTNGSSYQSKCKLNDFRIYNHCLSEKEIKEISKGLVLHYPLNKNTTYTSLKDKTAGYNVYNNFGSDVTTSLATTGESYRGSPVRRLTMTIKNSSRVNSFKTDLWSHGVYGWSSTFKANTKYVFWIYYKPITHTDIRVGGTASNISGWTEIPPQAIGDGWYRVGQLRNGSVTTDKTDSIFVSFTWTSAAINTPISIDFACPILIEGLTEVQQSAERNRANMVYDSSGFGNNGEIIGTWNSAGDSPKYDVTNHMSATTSKIHISNFPTSGFGNSYSFAWWGKRNSNGPMFWGFSDGIRLNGMYSGTLWNTGDGSSNPIYKPGTTTTITAPSVNVWHHYVMTGDGNACKLYLDGELYGQAKTYKAISGTSIWINGWDSGTSYCSDNTDISDFRVYATALSAADIKSLYQNEAYVDASENIYGKIRN